MVVVDVFCRETVAQMIQGGHRVIDNPVYLSDLGIVWLCLYMLLSVGSAVGEPV